eukprot:TRINITY_DN6026_c0_g1_i1.p1 TRINITY_DN6026_c0_g1~~TRINITY_DN6026_c0_g1_i1.p1  ORF type:complete len:92 (+),score=0.07 TRINITY_DN6026_c0_g1_i1:148-423(+)
MSSYSDSLEICPHIVNKQLHYKKVFNAENLVSQCVMNFYGKYVIIKVLRIFQKSYGFSNSKPFDISRRKRICGLSFDFVSIFHPVQVSTAL